MKFGEGAPEPQKKHPLLTRRAFLGGAAGMGAAYSAGLLTGETPAHADTEAMAQTEQPPELSFLKSESSPKRYPAGLLAGKKFRNEFADYLGTVPGEPVAEYIEVDFAHQLALLWRKKLHIPEQGIPDPKLLERYPLQLAAAESLYRQYRESELLFRTLGQYLQDVDAAMQTVRASVSGRWSDIASMRGLAAHQLAFAQGLESRVTSRSLIATALTELMPSSDGATNASVMDFLLRNGGSRFVESIPSLHDTLVSFGPYQLTDAVLHSSDTGSGAEKFSRQFVPAMVLPQSVSEVSGRMHHTVAYLLALDACLSMASHAAHVSPAAERQFLAEIDNTVAFTAAAHHLPRETARSVHTYLQSLARPPRHSVHGKAAYTAPLYFADAIPDRALAEYAHKAIINYHALEPEKIRIAAQ